MRLKIEKPILNCMRIIDVLKIIDDILFKVHRLRHEIQRRDYFSSEDFSNEQLLIEAYDYPIFIDNEYYQLNYYTIETLEFLRKQLKYFHEEHNMNYFDDAGPYTFKGF